jgi:hypothetical protein
MDRPEVRASDAERNRAVDLLRDAAAEGRLTFEELADRIGIASAATTRAELERLTADLPVPAGAISSRAPAVAPVKQTSVFGDVDLLVPESVVVEVRSHTFIGDIRQEAGDAGPPGAPRIILVGGSIFGDVKVRARRLREKLAERFLDT